MIGNDIIDIEWCRIESNWQRKGFMQKVFHVEEQEIIRNIDDPFTVVWRMWSMKESAYKLYLQYDKKRALNPSSFICRFSSPAKGTVTIDGFTILTNSMVHPDYIFTVATQSNNILVNNTVFHLPNTTHHTQQQITHQKVLEVIAEKHNWEINDLRIRKTDQNIPTIYYMDENLQIPISLSHHGHFGGFSYIK